ncbi:hypothetical protein [Marinifilum fragile]|uniref:hypothetical protein n=1 Tax=Marinifilum fragile TaxID=570161 RepID=UPI002AA6C413|nr:hypothetical protein [Marinifilum fragile]
MSQVSYSQVDIIKKFQKGDTIRLVSHDLLISLTDKVDFKTSYDDQKVRDSLKIYHNNHHQAAIAFENYKLKFDSNFVSRRNDSLFVKLENKRWHSVHVNSGDGYEEVRYNYENYFYRQGFYFIRIQYPEGNGYKLIDNKSGESTYLFGDIYFNNEASLAVSINCDIETGCSHNGIQLFDFSNIKPDLILKYSPEWWGPTKVNWLSDDELIVEIEAMTYENKMWMTKLIYIKLKFLPR